MITIGLTGGIGSGKSYICHLFEELGVVVYDADNRAKELMVTNTDVVGRIKNNFGEEAYHEDGSLNRAHLAKIVFGNNDKLTVLNSIVHPAVSDDFAKFVLHHQNNGAATVLMEAAVLVESGFHKLVDKVVVVSAEKNLRLKRTVQRDQIDEVSVQCRMNAQMSDDEREGYADYVIYNNEKELLLPQILEILKSF